MKGKDFAELLHVQTRVAQLANLEQFISNPNPSTPEDIRRAMITAASLASQLERDFPDLERLLQKMLYQGSQRRIIPPDDEAAVVLVILY